VKNIKTLDGLTTAALYHPPPADGAGVPSLKILAIDNRLFRFSVEVLDGECWGAGNYVVEHFSLILESADGEATEGTRIDLPGTILSVQQIVCDEWLGPVDHNSDGVGENPRMLFDGRVGAAPPGAQAKTVVRGALLQSETWKLLVLTDAFPFRVNFTLDAADIANFLDQYA
jgi:hypothetical protein